MSSTAQAIQYTPNYAAYSRAPQGWHDEPFEYVFTFQQNFTPAITAVTQATLLNQPMQLDPDADFFMRGMAILIEKVVHIVVEGAIYAPIPMSMRMRNAYGRALDSGFIPLSAYAGSPNFSGTPSVTDPWPASPWFQEMFCPANSAMFVDLLALATGGTYYSFHIYLQGVKRYQNESCKPGQGASTAKAAQ
jgi:hypothetical protein